MAGHILEKTNGLLKCLEKGGEYLGDDKVIMDRNGKIHPYPLRINLFGYNFDANPWLIERAYSPMRFKWLNWWNKRANKALEKPWNKGPLREVGNLLHTSQKQNFTLDTNVKPT